MSGWFHWSQSCFVPIVIESEQMQMLMDRMKMSNIWAIQYPDQLKLISSFVQLPHVDDQTHMWTHRLHIKSVCQVFYNSPLPSSTMSLVPYLQNSLACLHLNFTVILGTFPVTSNEAPLWFNSLRPPHLVLVCCCNSTVLYCGMLICYYLKASQWCRWTDCTCWSAELLSYAQI